MEKQRRAVKTEVKVFENSVWIISSLHSIFERKQERKKDG